MQYIIIDLEWNTAFCKEKAKYINEIIEIGAVKLNDKFEQIDSFSEFVKPQIETHIRKRVTALTSITNKEFDNADGFITVYNRFCSWSGDDDTVFLSWGDMDIRVMTDNCLYYFDSPKIAFVKKYVNFQDYFMKINKLPKGNQISLTNAALMTNIDVDKYPVHRAMADSFLTAEVFRRCYDTNSFVKRIILLDDDFYKKIMFKPYIINDLNDPQIDAGVMNCLCPMCFKPAAKIKDFKFAAGCFRAIYKCPECKTVYKVSVQFKRQYDTVKIKKSISPVIPAEGTDK